MKAALLAFVLTAPAIAVDQRAVEGNPASTVRVIVYEDLQCSDCAAFRVMLDKQLLPKYGSVIAVEHRDFPLAKHAWAKRAAVAARYFDELRPGLGFEFRRMVMGMQEQITAANFDERLSEFALSHDADPAKVKEALSDERLVKLVERDLEDGIARGVARTPTVFVDGEPFIETFTVAEISKGIDSAVARSKQ